MIKLAKSGGSTFWVAVMTLGILGCLAGMAYTFFMVQQEAGEEGKYRIAADEMRLLSQRVAAGSRESLQGDPEVFDALGSDLQAFEAQLASLQDAALQEEIDGHDLEAHRIRRSAP